ncbi:MAG TPA: LacI family DNA-binding transcriptional regulator [Spirochaetia bacterium]|nr:LacI family DNA-binding transcriptional regulator [Spirochaetia bacterium]
MGIKEIAEQVGVSKSTVSLALNGRKGVSYDTRMRIIQLAQKMNYRIPSERVYLHPRHSVILFARLRKHGLILNEDQNSFIMDYIDGMNQIVNDLGYTFEIYDYRIESMREFILEVQRKQPEGLIILGTELEAADILTLSALSIPFVVIDTYFDYIPVNFVDMENMGAVHAIIEFFVRTHHQEICMVTCTTKTGNVLMRERGFIGAMDFFSLPMGPDAFIPVRPGFTGAYSDMLQHISSGRNFPQAIFCYNDIAAFGVMKALKESGYMVPQNVSLIGFDDLPMSSMIEPRLTSIKVPNRQIGNMAVRLLIERLTAQKNYNPSVLLIHGNLIIRDSVIDRNVKGGLVHE